MDDLSERLFAHFVGGRWRAPFGTEQIPVPRGDGTAAGSVVLAGPRDLARAQACLRGADQPARERAAKVFAELGLAHPFETAQQARAPMLVSMGVEDRQALGAALGAGLAQGVIWCPPPRAALTATDIALRLQGADLPPGCFALIHAFTPRTAPLLQATGLACLAAHK